MCKPTESIDFFIPVILAQPGTKPAFGPLFDERDRTQIDETNQNMSSILISTKRYCDDEDHERLAASIAPKYANLEDKLIFDPKESVYLSTLQDFESGNSGWNIHAGMTI